MYNHNTSVFNNLCLRVPKNPNSDSPIPIYEQKFLNQMRNQETKNNLEIEIKSGDKETLKSFIDFFDSIPEYDDINHLSNKEFYKKLDNLKEKQKTYYQLMKDELRYEQKDTEWVEDYKKLSIGSKSLPKDLKRKSSIKPFCTTPVLNKSTYGFKKPDDVEYLSSSENKPPSRRSVRIETPVSDKFSPEREARSKSRTNLSSGNSSKKGIEWDNLSLEDLKLNLEKETPLEIQSLPNSPKKERDLSGEAGITIPKPFQMTVR